VVGATWAKSALSSSQSASPPWTFQTLYAALDAAWLQEQEEAEILQFDGKVHGRSETTVERQIPGLYFQGQGMYGRPKAPGSRSSAPSRSSIGTTSNNAPGKDGINRGSLDCATIASRQIILFEIARFVAVCRYSLPQKLRMMKGSSRDKTIFLPRQVHDACSRASVLQKGCSRWLRPCSCLCTPSNVLQASR
jgi:hypothetical protein